MATAPVERLMIPSRGTSGSRRGRSRDQRSCAEAEDREEDELLSSSCDGEPGEVAGPRERPRLRRSLV